MTGSITHEQPDETISFSLKQYSSLPKMV